MRARWSGKTPSKAEFSFHRIELRHHHHRLALPPPSPPPSPSFLCMSLKRIEKQRPCRADRNRPQSPLPSFLLLLNCFLPLLPPLPLTTSPSAEETVVSLSLPINTSRSLPRSDSRFKSLQMQRKEESRLPLSLSGRHAGRDRGRHARPAAVRSKMLYRVTSSTLHSPTSNFGLPSIPLSHWPSRRPQV